MNLYCLLLSRFCVKDKFEKTKDFKHLGTHQAASHCTSVGFEWTADFVWMWMGVRVRVFGSASESLQDV